MTFDLKKYGTVEAEKPQTTFDLTRYGTTDQVTSGPGFMERIHTGLRKKIGLEGFDLRRALTGIGKMGEKPSPHIGEQLRGLVLEGLESSRERTIPTPLAEGQTSKQQMEIIVGNVQKQVEAAARFPIDVAQQVFFDENLKAREPLEMIKQAGKIGLDFAEFFRQTFEDYSTYISPLASPEAKQEAVQRIAQEPLNIFFVTGIAKGGMRQFRQLRQVFKPKARPVSVREAVGEVFAKKEPLTTEAEFAKAKGKPSIFEKPPAKKKIIYGKEKLALKKELEKRGVTEKPAVKEPWEMTREEYQNQIRRPRVHPLGKGMEASVQKHYRDMELAPKRHKRFVQQALSEGKSPYKGWKKDYPELAKGVKGKGFKTIEEVNAFLEQRRKEFGSMEAYYKNEQYKKDIPLIKAAWETDLPVPKKIPPTLGAMADLLKERQKPKPSPIPKELEGLAEEARKYKTAEGFNRGLYDKKELKPLREQLIKELLAYEHTKGEWGIKSSESFWQAAQRGKGAEVPPKKAPPPVVPKKEPSILGLNKVEQDRIRHDLNLDKLEPAKRRTWERTLSEAKESGLDERALTVADEVVKSQRPISDAEHAGMVLKAARLVDEYDAAIKSIAEYVEKADVKTSQMERVRADVIIEQLDKLTDATRLGRRETARALSIGRMMVNRESYTLAHVIQRAQMAKGAKLSPQENARFEKLAAEHSVLEATIKELEAKYEKVLADKNKALAKAEVQKVGITRRTVKAREKLISDRENIKKQLVAMGFRVNDVTGITTEGAYLVGKLAVNYIKDGVLTLDGVVKKVLADVPELTEGDVHRSLAMKNHKLQQKAQVEVTRRVARLKNQARLLVEIEKAERGIFEPRRKTPIQPAEIKALQKKLRDLRNGAYQAEMDAARLERTVQKINELQDQLANNHRAIRNGRRIDPPEIIKAKEKLREIRSQIRVEDELTRLNEQIRTREFEVKQRPEPKVLPPELQRKQIELRRLRRQIRTAIEDAAPITARKLYVEAINTLRTMKATADMSGTLRQGLVGTVRLGLRNPRALAYTTVRSMKSFFSENTAEAVDYALRSADQHYLREKAGLEFTEFGGRLTRREEMFGARGIEKLPGIGSIVKASNRHMTTYLNMLRAECFDQFLRKYPNATHAELKAWADWINIHSGRGNLGRASAIANELSLGIFAPRFSVSRVQAPYIFFKYIKMPRVRAEIAKDLVTTASLGATAMTLAYLGGQEVGLNPREADFGKIRIGDTRIDLWGGFQQPIRVITRIGLAATDRLGLTGHELTETEKQKIRNLQKRLVWLKTAGLPSQVESVRREIRNIREPYEERIDPVELIGRFSSYKLAPSVTIPRELMTGKTAVGEPITPMETTVKAFVPMIYEDIYDAWRLEGSGRAALVGGLTFFGVGAGTYRDRISRIRRDIRQAFKSGNEEAAYQKWFEWNSLNPDNRISHEWYNKTRIQAKP